MPTYLWKYDQQGFVTWNASPVTATVERSGRTYMVRLSSDISCTQCISCLQAPARGDSSIAETFRSVHYACAEDENDSFYYSMEKALRARKSKECYFIHQRRDITIPKKV